jgi:ubiquinone/menaquinone biosynthesis C-methylase UbiE
MSEMYDQIAQYYDLTHADLTDDIAMILSLAQEADGPVLELGCGSGRLLLPLARAGYSVTGLDNSQAMLARAREKLAMEPAEILERVTLIEADMTNFTLPGEHGRFQLAIIPYNTFLHLDSTEKTAALKRIRRVLAKDGRLFIDLINPFIIANSPNDHSLILENSFTDPESGSVILQLASHQLDNQKQHLIITWVYDASPPDGGPVQRTVAAAGYHYLFPHQLELLLQETGFRLANLVGDYDKSPFNEECERLLMTAVPTSP